MLAAVKPAWFCSLFEIMTSSKLLCVASNQKCHQTMQSLISQLNQKRNDAFPANQDEEPYDGLCSSTYPN